MRGAPIIFLLLISSCSKPVNQETINFENEQILVGTVTREGLSNSPYSDWFKPNYTEYQVDSATLDKLGDKLNEVDIIVFLGTWCSDSQLEIPQFYKILDRLEYNTSKIEVIAIEKLETGQLVSSQHEEEDYGITHVPTFIFKRSGKEIGRIIEYPDKTLEKDMVRIVLSYY